MSANSFGQIFRITSFGESHGTGLGVVIDGCPAGIEFQPAVLGEFLERRRPGSSDAVSGRGETDEFEILSGIFEGKTLGTPIAVLVRNRDARSADYDAVRTAPRAGHADDVWREKFGHSDHRGGGRSSGRETLARVIGGAFAKMFFMQSMGLRSAGASQVPADVVVFPRRIGPLVMINGDVVVGKKWNLSSVRASEITEFLSAAKAEGQSYGGLAEVRIVGAPKSLGQPVFHKIKADLASAMMSIGATSGFELGEGFAAASAKGTEFHSSFAVFAESSADQYGGIRGGITTGEDIIFRVAFKPTSSILDVAKKGRHDPCIVLRALAVVEAMTWLVLADHLLWSRLNKM